MLHDQAKAAAHAQARAATHEQGKATAHEQEKAATHAQAKAATHAQGKATTHEQENVATLEQGKAATHAQAKAATQEQAKAATHEQAKAAAVEHETHASSQHAQEKAATVQREGTGLRQRGQEMVSMELTGQAQEGDKKDEKEWVVPLAVGIAVLVLVGAAISAAIWFRRDIIPPTDGWKEHVAELEKVLVCVCGARGARVAWVVRIRACRARWVCPEDVRVHVCARAACVHLCNPACVCVCARARARVCELVAEGNLLGQERRVLRQTHHLGHHDGNRS